MVKLLTTAELLIMEEILPMLIAPTWPATQLLDDVYNFIKLIDQIS